MKGQPALASKLRLKLRDVVKQAREHLDNNRMRIPVQGAAAPEAAGGGRGGDPPAAAVYTDDLLGAILGNAELCEHLGIRPADVGGRMQLYEGLAINFVYDLGALSNKVRDRRQRVAHGRKTAAAKWRQK